MVCRQDEDQGERNWQQKKDPSMWMAVAVQKKVYSVIFPYTLSTAFVLTYKQNFVSSRWITLVQSKAIQAYRLYISHPPFSHLCSKGRKHCHENATTSTQSTNMCARQRQKWENIFHSANNTHTNSYTLYATHKNPKWQKQRRVCTSVLDFHRCTNKKHFIK